MAFLTPLFLLLGLLALPIILLYMLRLRRREVIVSSTMLWQKLLRDREANAPWQRLRRNLLLLLQLLILAALVLALARPFIPVPSVVRGSVVVLLDGSASMRAIDVAPDRFAAAKAEVASWIDDLGGSDRMTLILVGQTPAVLVSASNDRNALREALAAAEPAAGQVDWPAALALASGAAQGFQDARIVVVSDGGLPQELPPLPVEAVYVPVGDSGQNLALTALATRQTVAGVPELFARVANLGDADQEALLSVDLNGRLFDARRITVPAGEARNLTWELPEEATTIAARLSEQTVDYLARDDQVWAVHEGGISNRVLLVTPGNIFLEQAYTVLPGIEAFRISPDAGLEAVAGESFDLYVFDSMPLPEQLPDADLFMINPLPPEVPASGEAPAVTVSGVFSATTVTRLADSPLLQFVAWSGIDIRQARAVSAPWATPLIEAEGGPLLLTGERNGHRVAILTFALQDSDLPLQIAFPVLIANITNWLTPGRAFDTPTGVQPGEPVEITPGASTTVVLVEKPDGSLWREPVAENAIIFDESEQLGLYQVLLRDAGGDRPAGRFAVNLFSRQESDIRPAATLQLGQATVRIATEEDVGQRELWPWLTGVAVLILVVEWWVYFRGARLPQLELKRNA